MDNKLVFKPQTLTTYNWNKYRLFETKTHKWEKYETVPEYKHHYFWNKYTIVKNMPFHIWKVYDTNDNYLGEIGSYNRNDYPDNDIEEINGVNRKFVYDRVVNEEKDAYAWDVYQNNIKYINTYHYKWKKYTKLDVPQYRWYQYILDQYGGYGQTPQTTTYLVKRFENITGNINANYITIESVIQLIALHEDNKFILCKTKPTVIRDGDGLSGYSTYIRNNNSIVVDISTMTDNSVLLNYISNGYKYWVPSKKYSSSQSGYSKTKTLGLTGYYELLPETYLDTFKNSDNASERPTLHNVVRRASLDVGSNDPDFIYQNKRIYGDISANGEAISSKVSCFNYYDFTGILPTTNIYTYKIDRNYWPDDGPAGIYYYRYDSSYIGTTSIKNEYIEEIDVDFVENIPSSLPYPRDGVVGDYYYELVNTSITTSYTNTKGAFLYQTYTALDDIYTEGYNVSQNTWITYRGKVDIRFKHKWYEYTKQSNLSTTRLEQFEWNVCDWNTLPEYQISSGLEKLYASVSEHQYRIHREGNKIYYCPFEDVGIWFDNLIGANNIYKNGNSVEYVHTDYYTSPSMPAVINNQIGIHIDFTPGWDTYPNYNRYNASFIEITVDENDNYVSGKGYLFAEMPFINRYTPVEYIREVYSLNRNEYPDWGTSSMWVNASSEDYPSSSYENYMDFEDGKFYIYQGFVDNDGTRGTYIETVETNEPNVYPNDNPQGEYWYVYVPVLYYREVIAWIKQNKIANVEVVNNPNAYPHYGVWPDNLDDGYAHYYYIYIGYSSIYSQGTLIDTVSSYIETAYPNNSYIIDDAWYIYTGSTTETTGELVIDNTKLMGGVNYKQEINPSEDLQIGTAGAAQVDFTIFSPDAAAAIQYLGKDFTYYVKMNSDSDWRQIGVFVLTTAELPDKQTAKIQGYDYIYKFDTVVDEWIDELTFPISLGDFFASLCEYVGCEAYSTSFVNSDFMVNDNFEAVNITGRTILQYITELSGGFCVAEPTGRIQIKNYSIPSSGAINLGSGDFVKYTHEIYSTPMITSVVVRKDEDDEGVESNV